MHFPAFSHAVALPAFRGRHPIPFLVAHLRVDHRLLLDTVDTGAMGVMEAVPQIPYPIKPVIGACAAVSYMKQEIRFYAPGIPDLSCLENLTGLKELYMTLYSADTQAENLDFLGKLTALRKLHIDGQYGEWKYGYDYGHNQYFESITDLSVLRNCPQLAYLTLTAGSLESYDFLENLPKLYQISLSGANIGDNIESLLPNACFIEINGKSVRFETGEGYEQYGQY